MVPSLELTQSRMRRVSWLQTTWRKHFCKLLNVHKVNDVRQTETHTADTLVPEPSASEIEMAI
jgi:hypothetical protein